MGQKLKVAVIGLGTMGKVHTNMWSNIPQAELVAVHSLDVEKMKAVAARYGAAPVQQIEELLASDVDVVDICLPTYLHKPYIIKAAEAGKHVISEKPLGLNAREAESIIQVCEKYGVSLFVAQVVRFFPEYAAVKEQIADGRIGKPGVVRLSRGGAAPIGWENWYADDAKSGGLILDSMIHDFDWLRWTFGDVKRVMARCVSQSSTDGHRAYALVTLRMEDGTIGHVEGTWAHQTFKTSFEIAGDQGMLAYDSQESAPLEVSLHSDENGAVKAGVSVPESPLNESPYQRELAHFADCLLTGKTPIVTAYDALKAVEISEAAIASAMSGRPVELENERGGDR
ncbi:Gfo/Idh/MocA family protein [Camelliibacillus cellulosilyticus]|uniref:Gfo/Idh/MocA family protein n=1 Tax=Camelliibacillus cellulosilyticus TaxID=2174486 RepID=A0ABV9GQR9_9BACL